MKNVVFFQGYIPEYRKSVFNTLAEFYNVTVIHSGKRTVLESDQFKEVCIRSYSLGKMHFQNTAGIRLGEIDATVAMFDIWWPAQLFACLSRNHGRRLLWGHRVSKSPLANLMRSACIRRADGLIQYSKMETSQLINNGVSPCKIFHAMNSLFIPNAEDLSKSNKNCFLFVGRLQSRKRVSDLVNAYASLDGSIKSKLYVDIVGEGDERRNLEKLVNGLGLSTSVRFFGDVRCPEKLKSFFERAIAYVSPGPVGLGVVHSMSYGVPVVTVSSTGLHGPEFSYLKSGSNSVILESTESLGFVLNELALDRSLAGKLGSQAFLDYGSHGTFDSMIGGIVAAIEGDTSSPFCANASLAEHEETSA